MTPLYLSVKPPVNIISRTLCIYMNMNNHSPCRTQSVNFSPPIRAALLWWIRQLHALFTLTNNDGICATSKRKNNSIHYYMFSNGDVVNVLRAPSSTLFIIELGELLLVRYIFFASYACFLFVCTIIFLFFFLFLYYATQTQTMIKYARLVVIL